MEPGAVFTIEDKLAVFPESRLANAGERTMHATRPVILMQAIKWSRAASPKTVLVVPCSSSGSPGPMDIAIPAGESGFDAPNVIAYTSLLQPILKSDLLTHKGTVSGATLAGRRYRWQDECSGVC